jgi:hypothetical protein
MADVRSSHPQAQSCIRLIGGTVIYPFALGSLILSSATGGVAAGSKYPRCGNYGGGPTRSGIGSHPLIVAAAEGQTQSGKFYVALGLLLRSLPPMADNEDGAMYCGETQVQHCVHALRKRYLWTRRSPTSYTI